MTMAKGQQKNDRINRRKEEEEEEEAQRAELQSYIPDYLKQFITPYHDEFCYTRIYDERLVAALMVEGFLPIATEGVILPKLHHHRSVVSLPESLHVSKSIRKKSKKYILTINQCFDRVVEGCRRQHGPRCWVSRNESNRVERSSESHCVFQIVPRCFLIIIIIIIIFYYKNDVNVSSSSFIYLYF
jgi:hypothetical protein